MLCHQNLSSPQKYLVMTQQKYGTTRPRPQLSLLYSPEGSTYAVRYSS